MIVIGVRAVCLLIGIGLLAPAQFLAREPDYRLYNELLAKYVRSLDTPHPQSWVHYSGLKRDPKWTKWVNTLSQFPVEALDTPDERLAFFINVYNVMAIKMVLDHWPVKGIRSIGHWWQPVWKKPVGQIANRWVTLDELEHHILRPFKEPRIHFVIVCASKGCPNLPQKAFTAKSLDVQLDRQTLDFLNHSQKGVRVNVDHIHLSSIFSWFEEDFISVGGVIPFIRRYRALPDGVKRKSDLPYDWSLNGY